jgi:excisionase family DNA binding protein
MRQSNQLNKSDNDKSLGNLLTAKEAAMYLRISRTTMHRLIKEQKIGHVKIGGRVLIPSKSINAFLEKNYVAPFDSETIARRILEGRVKL